MGYLQLLLHYVLLSHAGVSVITYRISVTEYLLSHAGISVITYGISVTEYLFKERTKKKVISLSTVYTNRYRKVDMY